MSVRNRLRTILPLGFVLWVLVSQAAAEELTLKNGQKIIGTIVGYEDEMFRVETEFGFALIRKDKVAAINFAAAGSKEAAQKRGERKNVPSAEKQPAIHRERTADEGSLDPARTPQAALTADNPKPPKKTDALDALSGPPSAADTAPPVSRPLDEPLPPQLQERVEGNNYLNDTFHFAMFKPPGWKIHEGVHRETGSAIVAMGPEDEQTLLIVDRQVWSGTPNLQSDEVEAKLRQTYQDFQKFSESSTQVDRHPAIRRVFKGLMEGVEWHGVSVHVARGNMVFGIIGLTSAETFQFQQAIFNKIINSFRFLTAAPRAASGPEALTSSSPNSRH